MTCETELFATRALSRAHCSSSIKSPTDLIFPENQPKAKQPTRKNPRPSNQNHKTTISKVVAESRQVRFPGSNRYSLSKMTKRKKSLDKTPKESKRKNPFLEINETNLPEENDDTFQHVLAFMELVKQADKHSQLREHVKALLAFLEQEKQQLASEDQHHPPVRRLISSTDVATLLLPWAIKSLLHSQALEKELEWETLQVCLDMLLLSDSMDIGKILTQSTLNKLVPLAGQIAVRKIHSNLSSITAKCYCLLVDSLYRPTFDLICNSLLPLLAMTTNTMEAQVQAVVPSTLRLLRTMQAKANPKNSFQILVKPQVILALSDVYNDDGTSQEAKKLVQEILFDGLFSQEHHLDGFKSLKLEIPVFVKDPDAAPAEADDAMDVDEAAIPEKSDPKFRIYQSRLFENLALALTDETSPERIVAATKTVPLLLQGFLEQTLSMEQSKRDKGGKKRHSKDNLGHFQFRFFASLTEPLVRKLLPSVETNEFVRATALASIHQCLALVLKHDVYLPSNEDVDNKHFEFLEGIGTVTLKQETEARSELAESLLVLEVLARLNHLLLHERLTKVLLFTVKCQPVDESDLIPQAVVLFYTIVSTYQKLRQLDYLYRSTLDGVKLLQQEKNVDGLHTLKSFVANHKIASGLGRAVESSPNAQILQVFRDVNAWIEEFCKAGEEQPKASEEAGLAISVVVRFFATLIRNVRVDKTTSSDIDSLCRGIMDGSVRVLIGENDIRTSKVFHLVKEGLTLCGWTIELQTRCAFWMGNEKDNLAPVEDDMPAQIVDILTQATKVVGIENPKGKGMDQIMDELLFLSCHRIQQLHSIIHEQQRIEFASVSDSTEVRSKEYVAEAKRLTAFALDVASKESELEGRSKRGSSRWKILAETIVAWTPYSEPKHVESFLSWMFSALSMLSVDNIGAQSDSEVAISLLRDANFFEIQQLSSGMGHAALSSAAEFMDRAISLLVDSKDVTSNGLLLSCPLRSKAWETASIPQISTFTETKLAFNIPKVDLATGEQIDALLNRALRVLMVLNGISISPWRNASTAFEGFDASLRMDLLCRSLVNADSSFCATSFRLLCATRVSVARILPYMYDGATEHVKSGTSFQKLLKGLFESTTKLFEGSDGIDESSLRQLVNSSKKLIGSVAEYCFARQALSIDLCKVINIVFSSKGDRSESEMFTLSLFGRCILQRLIRVHDQQLEGEASDESAQDHAETVKAIFDQIQSSLWESVLSIAFEQDNRDPQLKAQCILLVAELVRYSTRIEASSSWLSSKITMSIEDSTAKAVLLVVKGEAQSSEVQSISYLVACVSLLNPSSGFKQKVVSHLLAADQSTNNLLEAGFCSLIKGMNNLELRGVLNKIVSRNTKHGKSTPELRLFRLIVRNLNSEDQVELISSAARYFFTQSLQFLTSPGTNLTSWKTGVSASTSLIIDMAGNKNVISLRDRDIALVLAHTNSVLGTGRAVDTLDFLPVPAEVYGACFSLLSLFLQRFSKQLYVCVPSIISTLNSMLRHALYGSLGELDIMDRGQKFTRLCELLVPHRDVYKKHVLGLLIEFVNALRGDMDLVRKNSLTPGVYCLLDMLQQYETKQLNSMMDTTEKALFRTVHQNYQKLHVYKGQ
jgi:hypothetical protein